MTQGRYRAMQRERNKKAHIARLKREGRHGEAALMHLRDYHLFPESFRQAFIAQYNRK
ncbi:hypothetical protein [Marinobacterium rhizophilum]|uniref:Uncharacterized protein n=1 Tax=Marinobacterium rhizophilum TaxID=420402 RepID=A0ABY5HLV2_9GAMM|nr:hypothetical protein [Marinobacterium rhizophilum]UTW13366.1 hypothetical protein KDW95_06860 [Marinobacterium rhizophilum]